MSPVFSEIHGGYGGRRKRGGGKKFLFLVIVLLLAGGVYLYYNKTGKPLPFIPASSNEPSDSLMPELALAPAELAVTIEYSAEAQNLFADAKAAADAGQLIDARETLYKLLELPLPASVKDEAIKMLGDINIKTTVSALMTPEKEYYVIQSGDYLARIAKKYGTTVELIKKMNGLSTDMIRLGERLLVCNGTFTINASKQNNTLDLLFNGRLFKRYNVGTGRQGRTPIANFTIIDKIIDPPWYRPDGKKIEFGDPENELGTRWMAIESKDRPELRGFGIHGTWERDSIGKQSSAGCIRMLNEEVEELFDLVPRQTTVTITD